MTLAGEAHVPPVATLAMGRKPVRVQLAGGVELHTIEDGAGPPLFLLHGGLGDCTSWGPQMDALAPFHRVIAISRRHSSPNRNPLPAAYGVQDDLEDLEALRLQLGVGQTHLVGHSYGALIGLLHALRHPGQVLSLTMAEPPLHAWARRTPKGEALYTDFMRDTWRAAAAEFARGRDRDALERLVDGIAGEPVFQTFSPARSNAVWRNAGAMRALTRPDDPFPDVARVAVRALATPCMLLRGERCSPLHLCVMEELARELPLAEQAVIAGAGHGAPLENPAGFNQAVGAFLSRHRQS